MNILRHPLFWILLIGFGIRAVAIQPLHAGGFTSDEREYIRLATTISGGNPFIDSNGEFSTRSPLFPFWLSGIFRIAGNGLTLPFIFNCLLGVLVIFLVYCLGLEIFGRQTEALVAASIAAMFPGLVIYSSLLQSETISLMFFLAALLFASRYAKSPSIADAAIAGICCGFAALTRVVFLGFFPLLLFLMWRSRQEKHKPVVRSLFFSVLMFALVLAPWTFRNYSIHHTFVPVSSGGGNALLTGNNPFATGTWRSEPGFSDWVKEQAAVRGINDSDALPEAEKSSLAGKIALEYMMHHPVDVLGLMIKKVHILLVYPVTGITAGVGMQGVAVIFDYFFYVVSAIGFIALSNRKDGMTLLIGVIVYFILLHTLLHAESRFRLPMIMPLCLFAGSGLVLLFNKEEWKDFIRMGKNKTKLVWSLTGISAVYAYTALLHLQGKI